MRGVVELERGEYDLAEADLTRVLRATEQQAGVDDPSLAAPLVGIAEARLGLRDADRALTLLQRAEPLVGADAGGVLRGDLAFQLARALWETGRDRDRALELAQESASFFVSASANDAYARRMVPTVRAWQIDRQ